MYSVLLTEELQQIIGNTDCAQNESDLLTLADIEIEEKSDGGDDSSLIEIE